MHSLSYLHNDISPYGIVFDSSGVAVLIDLDPCTQIGEQVENGGVVGGWRRTWAFWGRYLITPRSCVTNCHLNTYGTGW